MGTADREMGTADRETEKANPILEKQFAVSFSDIANVAQGWNARCTGVQR